MGYKLISYYIISIIGGSMKKREIHGMSKHPLFNIWTLMVARCHRKYATSYKIYGAKGITVCKEWRESTKAFFDWALANGYKKGLQIDRIDNLKGYSPDNCRFVTVKENCLNRGPKSNTKSKYRGVSYYKSCNCWYIEVGNKEKRIRKGGFKTEKEAAIYRDKAAIELYGKGAWTNQETFPEDFKD